MRKRKQDPKSFSAKTCKELTELISDYVTGQLEPTLKREFEQHLSICPDCVNFLNSYKKTLALTGALEPTALPAKVRNNVLDFLRKKMGRIATFLFCSRQPILGLIFRLPALLRSATIAPWITSNSRKAAGHDPGRNRRLTNSEEGVDHEQLGSSFQPKPGQ